MKLGGREIGLSSLGKLIFPDIKVSKKELIAYYQKIAKEIIPQLKDRPLMLQRFPNGVANKGFYQKQSSAYFPDWIKTVKVAKEDGELSHVICNDKATLIYLVNQYTISFHTWLSKGDAINNPDKLIIDLDPSSDNFEMVRRGAMVIKKYTDELSLTPYVMTTGSSGVHIIIPLDGRGSFDESRKAGNQIAEFFTELYPELFTLERYKKNRQGRIYFDIQRNAYAQTGIAAYSLRPLPGAPVATPVGWEELQDPSINARTWHINNIEKRLAETEDPWKGMRKHAISVLTLQKKFSKLVDQTVAQ